MTQIATPQPRFAPHAMPDRSLTRPVSQIIVSFSGGNRTKIIAAGGAKEAEEAMPYLIQKQMDGSTVKQWDLRDKPLTVGRGDQVDAQIDDKEMSRNHFVIAPTSGGYVIHDQKSQNGTLVNGRRISDATLKPNDRIQAGQTNFVFVEGLGTVIHKLEQDPKGYRTHLRELSKQAKP